MIDLDHFKRVNDTYGHAKGDQVLKRAAQVIKGACRQEDIVARYGGGRVAILLPETDSAGAQIVTQRIQDAAFDKLVLENQERVTFSIGAACYPHCGAGDMTELIDFRILRSMRRRMRDAIASPCIHPRFDETDPLSTCASPSICVRGR